MSSNLGAPQNYEAALGSSYSFNRPLRNGMRPDAIDWVNNIVRELKPYTPSGIRAGRRQINAYVRQLEAQTGHRWTGRVDYYTPPSK
ncbi:hypothetical protein [Asticcacaulis machinosus]|uniref:hypothetical protein n=1 Tax=Asticcacaulis machinosus TaxID=2984211 RepID=UPI0034A3DCCD